jgi:hypothetical protein
MVPIDSPDKSVLNKLAPPNNPEDERILFSIEKNKGDGLVK